jgi:hypothetical protein
MMYLIFFVENWLFDSRSPTVLVWGREWKQVTNEQVEKAERDKGFDDDGRTDKGGSDGRRHKYIDADRYKNQIGSKRTVVYLRRCDRPEDIARHKEDGTNQKDGGCATHPVSPFFILPATLLFQEADIIHHHP